MKSPKKKRYRTADVVDICGVPSWHIYGAVKIGAVPRPRILRGRYVWDHQTVDRLYHYFWHHDDRETKGGGRE